MADGARNKPEWRERSRELKRAIRKSTTKDWRHHTVVDSLIEADRTENFAAMAEAVRKLGGRGKGFCST
eukprot:SAG11_NODE_22589_length_403_cov_1.016447_2_plen_68_part_01